jgi:hypothetical protein
VRFTDGYRKGHQIQWFTSPELEVCSRAVSTSWLTARNAGRCHVQTAIHVAVGQCCVWAHRSSDHGGTAVSLPPCKPTCHRNMFWHITPCTLSKLNWHFGAKYRLHLRGKISRYRREHMWQNRVHFQQTTYKTAFTAHNTTSNVEFYWFYNFLYLIW